MTTEERLSRLERSNRTWRIATLGLLGMLAGYLGCNSAKIPEPAKAATETKAVPDVIRARKIEIVNKSERVVLVLDTIMDGSGVLRISDSDGTPMIAAGIVGDSDKNKNPNLMLLSRASQPVVSISRNAAGGGEVEIMNPLGHRVLGLVSDNTNSGLVAIFDQNGKPKKAFGANGP